MTHISLFDQGGHRNVMLDEQDIGEAVQANHHVIVHDKQGIILDPGGHKAYRKALSDTSAVLSGGKLRYLFLSHQDPDIVAAVNGWLMTTDADAYASELWLRFIPHFGVDRLVIERLKGIPDRGMTLDLAGCPLVILPAHFLHSCGNFHLYDPIAKVLYSGDLGASLGAAYREVPDFDAHLPFMEGFHRRYMASNRALRAWVKMVRGLDIEILAPQHGALFRGKAMVERFLGWCEQLECGVDLLDDVFQVPGAGLTRRMFVARLLLVEDEATLRTSVARGLARVPGVEVVAVGTIADALTAIDQQAPNLVLSDIDLPDRSGIELLGELARRGLHCPVIFVSAYLRAYGAQIPPNAGVEVLEKPVSMEALREIVQRHLHTAPADAPFAVVDYIQLACMGHRSVFIEFRTDRRIGTITVKDGLLWSAEDPGGDGVPAFHRLAFRRDGHVDCTTLRHDPGPRTIHESWESLLLDAARILDETNRNIAQPESAGKLQLAPPLDAAPESPEPPEEPSDEEHFSIIWDQGLQALLARRYEDALRAFEMARELRPEDRKVLANIARLEAMGYHLNAQEEPS